MVEVEVVEEEKMVEMEVVEEVEVKERRRWIRMRRRRKKWRYETQFNIHVLNSNINFTQNAQYKHDIQLENYVFHIKILLFMKKIICLLFFEVYEVIFQLDFVDTYSYMFFFQLLHE